MRHVALMLASLLTAAILVYSIFVSISVRHESSKIASGQPYCLQTATPHDGYVPVRSFTDTLGLIMRGHGGYNHAVLVVGPLLASKTYHWSYWQNRFVEGSYGWPNHPVVCKPMADYLRQASELPATKNNDFFFDGVSYSIPREYRVTVNWPSSSPSITFAARAPDFHGSTEWCEQKLCNFVTIRRLNEPAQALFDALPSGYTIQDISSRYGLDYAIAAADERQDHPWRFYSHKDASGYLTTSITCFASDEFQCGHSFLRDGRSYRFSHMPADTKDWRTLQNRLAALVDSFVVEIPK